MKCVESSFFVAENYIVALPAKTAWATAQAVA